MNAIESIEITDLTTNDFRVLSACRVWGPDRHFGIRRGDKGDVRNQNLT